MTDTWPSWLLLDTHIALWLDGGSDRLRASTRSQIDEWWQNGGSVLLSAVSAWEIALLVDTGKITLDLSVEAWVERFTGRPGINVVPLSQHAAARAYRLHHRDPGDRLLIATSSHFPAYWSRMMPGFYSSPRRTEASTGLRLEAEAADRSQGLATGPGPRQPTRRHRMIGP